MARYSRDKPAPLSDMMMDPGSPRQRDNPALNTNFNWIDSKEPAKALSTVVRRLVVDQNSRLIQNTRFASLYANEDFLKPYRQTGESARPSMPRQTLNLIKVYTDTLAGKLVQSNSKVEGMSIQGDWETYKLTRKLGRLLDTTFLQGRLFRECSKVCIDALQCGLGHLYIGERDGKICYERWYYNEIFVDQLDAMYGNPTMLFRNRYMYPEDALAYWGDTPEHREAIIKAPRAIPPVFSWTPYEQGMIEIFEGWALKLPHRKGRHVLCTAYGTLVDEPYKKDCFPVVSFRASEMSLGWYGQGLIAHAAGAQIWLNRVLDIMARSAHLGLAPYWVVEGGASISVKQLNNVEGHIVTSNGPPPQWMTNKPFHETAPAYVELLRNELSTIYGISDIEAAGQQAGSRQDSNPALVQMQDMWMARHTIMLKNWSDEFFMDVAERTIEIAQDIAKRNGSYPVVATDRGRAWAMDWKDFQNLEREHYRICLGTESALPLSPAARNKLITDMGAQGLIPPDQVVQHVLGDPDTDSIVAQITAYQNNADWICEELMNGRVPPISGLQKPDLLLQRVRAAGLCAHEFGASDEIVMNFELYAAQLADIVAQTQAAMAPPAAPGAPPSGQPTSPI